MTRNYARSGTRTAPETTPGTGTGDSNATAEEEDTNPAAATDSASPYQRRPAVDDAQAAPPTGLSPRDRAALQAIVATNGRRGRGTTTFSAADCTAVRQRARAGESDAEIAADDAIPTDRRGTVSYHVRGACQCDADEPPVTGGA